MRRGHSYIAESSAVTLELTASSPVGDDVLTVGPGETLVTPPGAPVTVSAAASGVPGTSLALITAESYVARAMVDESGEGRLRWTTTGVGAHFARVEVRRQARLPSMVALTNPVFLRRVCADGAAYSPRNF
jgi:hypothetical protein